MRHSFWDNRRYYISSTFPIEEDLLVTASAEITRRKRMEEELRLQQQRLELALASARMIAWDWDCATDQFEISGDFAEIYGRPPFARPEEFLLLIHPDDMGRLRPEGKQSGPYHTEYRIIRPDTGAVVWLESRARSRGTGRDRSFGLSGSRWISPIRKSPGRRWNTSRNSCRGSSTPSR